MSSIFPDNSITCLMGKATSKQRGLKLELRECDDPDEHRFADHNLLWPPEADSLDNSTQMLASLSRFSCTTPAKGLHLARPNSGCQAWLSQAPEVREGDSPAYGFIAGDLI